MHIKSQQIKDPEGLKKELQSACILIGTVKLFLVLPWDIWGLKTEANFSYFLPKLFFILNYLIFLIMTKKNIGLAYIPVLFFINFFIYSLHGIIFIDSTYVYSFVEAFLFAAILFNLSKKQYHLLCFIYITLAFAGIHYSTEPAFVAPNESFKPHMNVLIFIIFILSFFTYHITSKRKKELDDLKDKFAEIGKNSAFAFHELKKPLHKMIYSNLNPESTQKEIQTMNDILTGLDLLHNEPADFNKTKRIVNLYGIIKKLDTEFGDYFNSLNVKLDTKETDLYITLMANEALLYQVFKNLTINALEALIDNKKEQTIKIKTQTEDTNLNIFFSNTGSVILPSIKDNIFIPFYTTKDRKKNSGIGLVFSKRIMEAHNGSISLIDTKNSEVCLKLTIPLKSS